MKRKLGFAFLYLVFGVITYVGFLFLTFPSDVARERLIYEADKAGIRLQLVDLKPSPPFGVTLKGVDIYGSSEASTSRSPRKKFGPDRSAEDLMPPAIPGVNRKVLGDEEEVGEPANEVAPANEQTQTAQAPFLTIEQVTISSLLPILVPGEGTFGSLNFDADLYGGTLSGSYGEDAGAMKIALAGENLDLSRYPFEGEDYSLLLGGALGVTADLSVDKEKIRESSGNINFSLDNLVIRKGSKIKGFDIPMELAFQVSGGAAEVKNGRAELEELKLVSTPLTVLISGSIMLNKSLSRCRFNLKVALKFGDELQVVSAFLPSSAKSDDDYYHYIISGPLDRMRTRPDRLAARRRNTSGTTTASHARVDEERPFPKRDVMEPGMMPNIPSPRGGPTSLRDRNRDRPPMLDETERERVREERRRRAEERRKRREAIREQRMKEMDDHGTSFVPANPSEARNMPGPGEIVPPPNDVDLQYRPDELDQQEEPPVYEPERDVPPDVEEVPPMQEEPNWGDEAE